jgi:hypothetical protein
MKPLSEIAGPIPEDSAGLHQWLVVYWEYQAALTTDPDEIAHCEDEAWRCSRLAAAIERDRNRVSRALAQQEMAA